MWGSQNKIYINLVFSIYNLSNINSSHLLYEASLVAHKINANLLYNYIFKSNQMMNVGVEKIKGLRGRIGGHFNRCIHTLHNQTNTNTNIKSSKTNFYLLIIFIFICKEISRIRVNLFQLGGKESVCLPEPIGTPALQTEKLNVPVKDHPEVSERAITPSFIPFIKSKLIHSFI